MREFGNYGDTSRPLITIVVAVLNRAYCIESFIESVINQSYKNVELIIIDGGSTDGTLEILKEYDAHIDCWVSEPDNGIYDALNKGIRLAKGDWINIQGSDDLLYDSLASVAPYLVSDHTIYYGDLFYKYQKKVNFGLMTRYQLSQYRFGHHRFFFPRHLFNYYTYNLRYPICADYEMVVRAYADKKFNFEYIPVVVAGYNDRDGASSHRVDHVFNRDRFRFMLNHFPFRYVVMFYLRMLFGRLRKMRTAVSWRG